MPPPSSSSSSSPASALSSDIQVYVRWKEQFVFSGENVECVITFKNTAGVDSEAMGSTAKKSSLRSLPPSRQQLHLLRKQQRQEPIKPCQHHPNQYPHLHSRSHSTQLPSRQSSHSSQQPILGVSAKSRSSSLNTFPLLSLQEDKLSTNVSPVSPRRSPPNASNAHHPPSRRRNLPPSAADFKFPPAPPPMMVPTGRIVASPTEPLHEGDDTQLHDPQASMLPTSPMSPHPQEPIQRSTPATKIFPNTSVANSTRSSGEFYSMSNNSAETLQSEYTLYTNRTNAGSLPPASRQKTLGSIPGADTSSRTPPAPLSRADAVRTLLMGYAQISASFVVDGSLVDQSDLEQVKHKAMVGVPGTSAERVSERRPPDSAVRGGGGGGGGKGFWDSIGLNNIGESLTGLFSGSELNGLREMRGVSSSQSVPLLSTPQSLLFVDLQLNPGEERSYSLSFTLPPGLPASHKGKAIKVSYDLIIGIQKANAGGQALKVNRINVPFRVISGVDASGRILGHDIMQPYVILRDEARIKSVESQSSETGHRTHDKLNHKSENWRSAADCLRYIDEMLRDNKIRHESNGGGLPPSITPSRLQQLAFDDKDKLNHIQATRDGDGDEGRNLPCKDAIDLAILRGNRPSEDTGASPNRFEITRNGRRVAVVILNRPVHRLGETVVVSVEFTGANVPSYSLRCTLESSEKIDPKFALRSPASIARATRRIHTAYSENALYATRLSFTPVIPVSATPTFITSMISNQWELCFEFVTSGVHPNDHYAGPTGQKLLEPLDVDDRATIIGPLEYIPCEAFDVSIPLTVYGGNPMEPSKDDEIHGIPI